MSPDGEPWVEFAVRVPAGGHDRIVTEVVGPFLTEAVAEGVAAKGLFLRGLGRGEQSRMVVQVLVPAGEPDAGGALDARVRRAAGAGLLAGVRSAGVVPLAGPVFAGSALASATRGFLAEVCPVLLELVAAGAASRPDRLATALDLMAGHLPVAGRSAAPGLPGIPDASAGVPLGFLSLRSHAEAFIVTSRDPVAARRAMDRQYEAARDTIERRVAAVLAQVREQGPTVSPAADHWRRAVRTAKPVLVEHFRAGRITAETAYVDEHLRDRDDFAGSSFHTTAGASADLQRYLRGDPPFLAARLLTSLLYLGLHNAGISLAERYLLCHLTSRACESLYQVDGVAVLAGLAGR
jgi:Lantibiotic biosynthesis dehydratase C-term